MSIFKYNFKKLEDIYIKDIPDTFALNVKKFYEHDPFPNYKIDDTKQSILDIGNKNFFSRFLKKQISFNKTVCEFGCGTAQLSNYLAINTNNSIFSVDISISSLKKGYNFSKAELEKKNKQGMKLKDVLSKVWMGGKIK